MRELLAAPMHPIFVHFSIALTAASLAFDTIGAIAMAPSLATAAWWSLATSTIATVGTIATGIISRLRLPMEEGPARSYLRAHMALGPIFLGLLLAMTVWRATLRERATGVPWMYLAALGGVVGVMAVQGYLGGELVYRFGAEVRGHFRPLPTEPPTRGTLRWREPADASGEAAALRARDSRAP
jgi:uncharacterized membrane protein